MKLNVKDILQVALFTALTAIGAFIKIPTPIINVTMQVFFVVTAGVLLGSKKGALSQALYVLIGLAGVPIFTNGVGITYIFKPSFGYLIGFIVGAYLIGYITERLKQKNIITIFISILAGIVVIYLIGVPYLYIIYNYYIGKSMSVWLAVYNGFILTISFDIVKAVVAAILCNKLLPILKKIQG